jgi:TP901 family phage tail tape measure protein
MKALGVSTLDEAKKLGILGNQFIQLSETEKRFQAVSGETLLSIQKQTKAFVDQGQKFDQINKHWQTEISSAKDRARSANTLAQAITAVARSFKVYARYMIASSVMGGFTSGMAAAKVAVIEFDQALHDLKAIMKASDLEITVMSGKLVQVAQDTKFSMGEVGEAMRKLGQAGFTAKEATQAITGISYLATGTLESLETTVNLVSTAVRIFGLSMTQTTEVTDIFANAVNKSRLTLDRLNVSFNYIGPLANAAGMDLKDTAAAMMLLANAGVRASTIGTGFRRILGGLLKPTAKFKDAVYEAGFSLADFNPELNDFSDIVERLPKVVTNARDAIEMFGYRGSSVIAVLVNKSLCVLLAISSLSSFFFFWMR